ncbi:MAG: MotA/TolQ/ExbB proton channel family protein [bacterium]|nr:MotA/TolQ/ExbB proton channel family protein [bacterium]
MFQMFVMLKQGGWIMVPLGACSIIGLTIIIERFAALRRRAVIDERVVRLLAEYSDRTSAEKAIALCRRAKGPFARLVEELIRARDLDHVQSLELMHATGRTQVGTLERGLILLEIIAGASPLLGLLGTVLGMRNVFDAITAQGLGNPQVLSGGISKALVTTVAGLCVAIPTLACHAWFCRRVDDLAVEMQDRGTGFIAKLQALRHR